MTRSSSRNSSDKYKTSVVLREGSALHLRSTRHDDEDRLLALFHRLSRQTIHLRFHGIMKQMSREQVTHFCTVDYSDSFALVATLGEDAEEKTIAVGRYYRLPKRDSAEVFVRCPLETTMRREGKRPRGHVMADLYKKALERRQDETHIEGLGQVVGVDTPFEENPTAECVIDSDRLTVEQGRDRVVHFLSNWLQIRESGPGQPPADDCGSVRRSRLNAGKTISQSHGFAQRQLLEAR